MKICASPKPTDLQKLVHVSRAVLLLVPNHDEVLEDGLSTSNQLRLPRRTRLEDVPEVALDRVGSGHLALHVIDRLRTRRGILLAGSNGDFPGCDVLVGHDALEDLVGGLGLVPWNWKGVSLLDIVFLLEEGRKGNQLPSWPASKTRVKDRLPD